MPVHDWTLVDAGIFHDFHNAWVIALRSVFNRGLLPPGYYALSEQHTGPYIGDVLNLNVPPAPSSGKSRHTVAIRHVSGHRLIALVEIISPGNKDRATHVDELVRKAADA